MRSHVNNSLPAKIDSDLQFGFVDRETSAQHLYNPRLINNRADTNMLIAIKDELRLAKSFTFSVAFITSQAIATLKQALLDFEGRGTIITSDYLDFNDPEMFEELMLLDNVEVRVLDSSKVGFHAKGYLFDHEVGMTAIIGSSNMTANALQTNEEWNLRFSAEEKGDIVHQIKAGIDRQLERSVLLSPEWIRDYALRRRTRTVVIPGDDYISAQTPPGALIEPNLMQSEALEKLRDLRAAGERRGLIISATGTGKTILAALAVREADPKRLLFLVHREQIVNKAMEEFQKVLNDARPGDFGKYVGATKQLDRKFVFATVQSLSKNDALDHIPHDHFDFIIIDEVHRAAAETYTRVIEHFSPDFLLGLTATPERTDGGDIYQLFDYNVPYEIRLKKALDSKMLVPFHYFGVTDYEKNGVTITEASDLTQLVADERVDHIIQKLTQYGHASGAKGLIFCSRAREAQELSDLLNTREINGRRLRTRALTGADSSELRERTVQELQD
ncbi:MAG: DEAD/DEAH box helicase family protein, partial [Trueperella sp.]|nr:DEAD/DEAH box helicase family protein [Trueperella sp.]